MHLCAVVEAAKTARMSNFISVLSYFTCGKLQSIDIGGTTLATFADLHMCTLTLPSHHAVRISPEVITEDQQ